MSSSEPTRPHHRRVLSSPHYPPRNPIQSQEQVLLTRAMASTSDKPTNSLRPRAASRLIHSVKRTLTPSSMPKKRYPQSSKSGMHSTLEESSSVIPPQQQQFRDPDPQSSRPTIEQIAMGLHISRTPHLRPLAASPYAFSQRNSAPHSANAYEHHHRPTPITLPPPPTRSSLKKPSTTVTSSSSSPAVSPPFSSASGSTTTVTSMTPSSAQSPRSFAAIKFRMARFLPHNRSSSAPSSMLSSPSGSPRTSTSDFPQPKKAVRFNTGEVVDGD